MKKFLALLFTVLFSLIPTSVFAESYVEGEIIISLELPSEPSNGMTVSANMLSAQATSFAKSMDASSVGTFPEISKISEANFIHLRSDTKTTEELINELKNNPQVKTVQPNYRKLPLSGVRSEAMVIPNDPRYSELWNLKNIRADMVWDKNTGSNGVIVAVFDTGIDYRHVDLAANMATDSYGKPGRRFYGNNAFESDDPNDIQGHGTHVAGIIGAVGNNGVGVVGVNWNVKLLAVNVFSEIQAGKFESFTSDQMRGIDYVLGQKKLHNLNIRAANFSLGNWEPIGSEPAYEASLKALSDEGIIMVFAAGNEAQNIDNPTGNESGLLPYPAAYKFDNSITVGSVNKDNGKSDFSNYSVNYVHIAAPGGDILSTLPGDNYGTKSGTSMAAPHVAGAAALLCAAYPNETASEIKSRILSGGTVIQSSYWRYGLLDAAASYGLQPIHISDSSGGGCNAFVPFLLILLLIPIFVKRKQF